MTTIRRASAADLEAVYDVFYANEVAGEPDPPPRGKVSPGLWHELRSGEMYVAEREGRVVAFAGAYRRGAVTFLADLSVQPAEQSGRLGTLLLRQAMPAEAPIRATMSSTDPRALALYVRAGMQPRWPHFCLQASTPYPDPLPRFDLEIVEASPGDAELVRWDAEIGGRPRQADHEYWVREKRAVPLWFRRQGDRAGYGYVRLGAGTLRHPDAVTIGPIGAYTPEDAVACVAAAVEWARPHAGVLCINVPGPHPSLSMLLAAHFHITYVETFLCTGAEPFCDGRRYLGADSSLF